MPRPTKNVDGLRPCNVCRIAKPFDMFTLKSGGRGLRSTCIVCESNRQNALTKSSRKDPRKRSYWVWVDAKKSDRKRGVLGTMSRAEVEEILRDSICSYCETTSVPMGLDRIDNTLGHSKANVVAACRRCNYLRRDMPYAAWCVIVPAVKQAELDGLFGTWIGDCKVSG